MIRWLQNRELTSIHNVLSMDLSCVLKPYHLRQILPPDASDDIFLGFSADGCFLISYKNDFKHHVIRFWLFPPRSTGNLGPKLALYSERKFLRTSYCPDLHNVPCVRFVQSLAVSNSFLLLACNVSTLTADVIFSVFKLRRGFTHSDLCSSYPVMAFYFNGYRSSHIVIGLYMDTS